MIRKSSIWKLVALFEAVVIAAVLIPFLGNGLGGGRSYGAHPADVNVVLEAAGNSDAPTVIPIALLEDGGLLDQDGSDPSTMADYLNRRLKQAGITLSRRYVELVSSQLGSAYSVYYVGLEWVQYQQFGLLVLKIPTQDRAADTCYVFENSRYKGYIGHGGWINTDDCFAQLDDMIWLKTSRFVHGTGVKGEERLWCRLTSPGLDCELRYTAQLNKSPTTEFEVSYGEEVVDIQRDGHSGIVVTTAWQEEISDNSDRPTLRFGRQDSNAYRLSPLPQSAYYPTYLDQTALNYEYYLIQYGTEFAAILQNGTAEQQDSLYHLVSLATKPDERTEKSAQMQQIYTWFLSGEHEAQAGTP